ncbi:nucleotide exchange factor GrpE [Agromyces sp. NPDC057865]|uniref:nucleotide exchange factor GrpE n=1 Tax=Agromyces sp. NPDC057865 TaxID=3346267 RepID=UPI00366C5487
MGNPEERDTDPEESRASSERPSPPEDPSPAPQEDLNLRVTELEDRWRRAAADLDNARKRAARDLALAQDAERARAASVFLPVVDGLQDAVTYAEQVDEGLAEGVGSIREHAVAALERLGYPRIDDVEVPFDPRVHEVVSVVDRGDLPPRTVAAVARLGFGTPERLLRPAGVVVTASEE